MNLQSTVCRVNGIVEAEVDNEIVLLNIDRGFCYGLNRVASSIWNLIAQPVQIEGLCKTLTTQYDVDMPTCERDVIDILEELRAEGMITASEAGEGIAAS